MAGFSRRPAAVTEQVARHGQLGCEAGRGVARGQRAELGAQGSELTAANAADGGLAAPASTSGT